MFIIDNCNIGVERKISFINETKWYEICPRPKGWVQKMFQTTQPNFVKGVCVCVFVFVYVCVCVCSCMWVFIRVPVCVCVCVLKEP